MLAFECFKIIESLSICCSQDFIYKALQLKAEGLLTSAKPILGTRSILHLQEEDEVSSYENHVIASFSLVYTCSLVYV